VKSVSSEEYNYKKTRLIILSVMFNRVTHKFRFKLFLTKEHRFFLVSLCLKANAEMVPKIPSCHYMLLM